MSLLTPRTLQENDRNMLIVNGKYLKVTLDLLTYNVYPKFKYSGFCPPVKCFRLRIVTFR